MLTDALYIYFFWLIIFFIGILFLPLANLLFSRFISKGYFFAKILGLVFLAFSVWLISLLHIAPFQTSTILAVAFLWLLVNLFIYYRQKMSWQALLTKFSLIEELLFGGFLTFWSYIRGFAPSIYGLEKFMDFGFINSILRTAFMPPVDMWLAPSPEYPHHFINYYYFGHFVTALLTKISQLPPEIVYNLMLGFICGASFTGVFSITTNLIYHYYHHINQKKISWLKLITSGLLAGFLVTFGGNLHTLYVFTKGYPLNQPQPPWQILGKPNPAAYWYPNATRFIKNTIHEFPSYSFIVSDLHGYSLCFVNFGLSVYFCAGKKTTKRKNYHAWLSVNDYVYD